MFTRTGLIPSALIALMTAGCASLNGLAPQSHLGSADDLQASETLANARITEAAWPTTAWWTDFGDPQLDRIEAEALAGSPSLQLAQARVAKALAFAGVTRSALRPHVDGNLAATRQRFSENDVVPKPTDQANR